MNLRIVRIVIALLLAGLSSSMADEIRVATWNITNYGGGRVSALQSAVYGRFNVYTFSPDILVVQEFLSESAVTAFRNLLNSSIGSPGDWEAARFIDGRDTDSAFFYRTSKVELAPGLFFDGVIIVSSGGANPNHPRAIMRYDVVLAAGTSEETKLSIYSTHMKAGSTETDKARRLVESQIIRTDAELLPPDRHFMLCGDFNIRSSSELAYVELVSAHGNNEGPFIDPIRTPGRWNHNQALRFVHTQDPAGGSGMDDRYDQLLLSVNLIDGVGVDYIGNPSIPFSTTTWNDPNHSYRSWGNDGSSYDRTLTTVGNEWVGRAIAQGLIASADGGGHIPVYLDLRVPPCPADRDCNGDVDLLDYAEFLECVGEKSQSCLDYFDLDQNGHVGLVDFSLLQLAF